VLNKLQLVQEESEPSYHETKAHQRETGPNPGKESALGG
jgi:hypothetical protein